MRRAASLLLVLPAGLLSMLPVPEFWITLANYIGLSALVALGLVLLTGIGGMTSFGQAAFVGIGAYTTAWLNLHYGLSPWLGLLAGLTLTAGSALMLGAVTLRLSGHYLPLGTIAWGLSLFYLFGTLEFLGKYDGLNGIAPIGLFGYSLQSGRAMAALIWLVLVVAAVGIQNLLRSRSGRAMKALNGRVDMAEAMGVDSFRMRMACFLIAALLACLSGWLYAHLQRAVNPTPFGLSASIEVLFMAVVGGIGHVWGAVLGAALLTLLKDQLQTLLPKLMGSNGNYEIIVFGVLMVVLLQRARDGLWPLLRRWWAAAVAAILATATATTPIAARAIAPALRRRDQPIGGSTLLEVDAVCKQFGGLHALDGMQFTMTAGEILGVIGPNGAGKSTLFNLISGALGPTSGQVRFLHGGRLQRIDGLTPRAIAACGIARTFQHVRLVEAMSVVDNVALGTHLRGHCGVVRALVSANREEEQRLLFEAQRQLDRVGLGALLHQSAGSLSLGQQRLLEIARALCADPTLLLLDEPAAGLRHLEKHALAELLRQLRAEGVSILLVEHDMGFVMTLCDRLVVMEFGRGVASGLPAEIQENPAVRAAYLGGID